MSSEIRPSTPRAEARLPETTEQLQVPAKAQDTLSAASTPKSPVSQPSTSALAALTAPAGQTAAASSNTPRPVVETQAPVVAQQPSRLSTALASVKASLKSLVAACKRGLAKAYDVLTFGPQRRARHDAECRTAAKAITGNAIAKAVHNAECDEAAKTITANAIGKAVWNADAEVAAKSITANAFDKAIANNTPVETAPAAAWYSRAYSTARSYFV